MFELNSYFHVPQNSHLLQARGALEALRPYAEWLGIKEAVLKNWYLTGNSLEDSLRYEVFDEGYNGQDAAVAVLTKDAKGPPTVGIWNGDEDPDRAATMMLLMSDSIRFSSLNVTI